MKIVAYKNDHARRFANIELPNGDCVHVRVTSEQVTIAKLRFGHIPLGVIWAATGPKAMGRLSYACYGANLLDAVIERLRACNCADDINNLRALADA